MFGTRFHLTAPSADLGAGLLSAAIGGGGLVLARDWPLGTPTDPGSGAFPVLICLGLIGLGALTIARAVIVNGEPLTARAWRPLLFVTLSVSVFALLLERIGLFVAILLLVLVADLAGAKPRPLVMGIFGAGLAGCCAVVFVQGLGLPIQVWP